MPSGKAYIAGQVSFVPDIGDCSCLEVIVKDRRDRKPLEQFNVDAEKTLINRALASYVGSVLQTKHTLTVTTVIQRIKKINTAAKKLLIEKKTTQYYENWKIKLFSGLNVDSVGPTVKQRLIKYVIAAGGDLSYIQKIQDSFNFPSNDLIARKTLSILGDLKYQSIVSASQFRDQNLIFLIRDARKVWKSLSDKSEFPYALTKDDSIKTFRFYEWLLEVFEKANAKLKKPVPVPKEGTVYDILKAIPAYLEK